MMFLSFPFLLCLFCPLIYICCSFHGLSMRAFPNCSHVIVACRGIWSSLFFYPLLFSYPVLLWCCVCVFLCMTLFYPFIFFPFLLCLFCPLTYICCTFHGHSICVFLTIATCLCPAGEPVPFSLILFSFLVLFSMILWCSFPLLPFLSFFSMFFCPLIYICCSFHGHSSMCVFYTIASCLWPAGQSGVPSSLILFSSLVYAFPFLSFSSMSFLPIDLYLL